MAKSTSVRWFGSPLRIRLISPPKLAGVAANGSFAAHAAAHASTAPSPSSQAREKSEKYAQVGWCALSYAPQASETTVKSLPLADYRIIYFATHGLVAGEVKGLGEPALALTIPKEPTNLDDGLLTASEVAQLKLNADWVVLSACNTIAGDKPGAEALSGLARAFFYAGARALLVSHWTVASEAATRLTTLPTAARGHLFR